MNEKLYNNTINNVNKKIKKLTEKYVYQFTNYSPEKHIYDCDFSFICPDHGKFNLTGGEIRLNKSCPICAQNKNIQLIHDFDSFYTPNEKLLILQNKFPKYIFNTDNIIELDNTIRPECLEHGEFLTTPRKLLDPSIGDSCKWCDGIHIDEEGNSNYKLNRQNKLFEKIQQKYSKSEYKLFDLKYIDPFNLILVNYHNSDLITSHSVLKEHIFANKEYSEYLSIIKEPRNHNSIFFKLNITDKSTKFQFTITNIIILSKEWIDWYWQCLETMDDDIAKDYATKYIISEWFHYIFYGQAENTLGKKDINFEFEISHYQWSIDSRIKLIARQYKEENENKIIHLPDSILSKIKYDLNLIEPEYSSICWSENRWDTTATSVSLVRESLLKFTTICPICKKKIKDPVVDHEHKKKIRGSGRIRNNICSTCNVFIAKTENNCRRFKIDLEELPQVLKNVSDYFSEQQYNMIHYTDKDKRPSLKKSDAQKVIKYWEVLYPTKKKPKIPRSGILTNDWEEYLKALEIYLTNPYPTLNKLVYNKLVKAIEQENINIEQENINLPKTRKKKLIPIPVFLKLKVITPEIEILLKQFNI